MEDKEYKSNGRVGMLIRDLNTKVINYKQVINNQ